MTYTGEGDRSAVLLPAGQQPRTSIGRTEVVTIASAAQTGGRYSLYRLELGPRAGGASPHFHRTFAEVFHVLSGSVRLYDGERWVEAGPDDHLVIPEGGVHGFRNEAAEPATMLMLSTPGAPREAYFAELAEIVRTGARLGPEEWTALYARHDQYMVPERPVDDGSDGAVRPSVPRPDAVPRGPGAGAAPR
jgi:mannose-6-phosphate isomerase-like protein (cupin superfamily)